MSETILTRPAPPADAGPLDERFWDLVDERVIRLVTANPPVGTFLGIHAYDDRLPSGERVVVKLLRPGIELLVETDLLAIGQAVIRRVRDGLASRSWVSAPGGVAVRVTASFGLASLDPEVSVEDAIERADQALLLAKAAGRNRAISWDPNVTTGTRLRRLRPEDVPGEARDETS